MQLDRWLSTIPLKLRTLFRHRRVEDELDEEMRYHLDRKAETYMAQGLSSEEADRAARLDFGGIEQSKEGCRDVRRWALWVEQSWQDIRYGLRVLSRARGFSTVAIVTLALGIGANAGIFTLLDQVLLRKLPVREPERLVQIDWRGGKMGSYYGTGSPNKVSYPVCQSSRRSGRSSTVSSAAFPRRSACPPAASTSSRASRSCPGRTSRCSAYGRRSAA